LFEKRCGGEKKGVGGAWEAVGVSCVAVGRSERVVEEGAVGEGERLRRKVEEGD
jgi:hypothetical protein